MLSFLSSRAAMLFSIILIFACLDFGSANVIPRDLDKRALRCYNDRVLMALKSRAPRATASRFCATFTRSTRNALPTYVHQYKASQVSSACKCLLTSSPQVTTTKTVQFTSTITSSRFVSTTTNTHTTSRTTTLNTSSKSSTTSSKSTTTSSSSSSSTSTSSTSICGGPEATPYWLAEIKHQGIAAFNANASTYPVYRNVKCYGAVGDGVTDDTAAINAAIAYGTRCGLGCDSSTIQPGLIYFPSGTYLISSPIIAYYYSQLVGNAANPPTLKATAGFAGIAMIDADPYGPNGNWYTNQNNFFREVRNFVLDTTSIPAGNYGTGIHWQIAQATNLQNIRFELSTVPGNVHQGIYMENGSGGFMSDLIFNNGKYGAYFGNQQFTTRNLVFNNQSTAAVYNHFDWGWTFKSMYVNNVPVALDVSQGGPTAQVVSSAILLDCFFTNVGIAVKSGRENAAAQPPGAGSIIIENLAISNVPIVVGYVNTTTGVTDTLLAGSTGNAIIANYGQGREYIPSTLPNGTYFQSTFTPVRGRPASLTQNGKFVEKSKPQYIGYTPDQFISARSLGAKGDGTTDDTVALQNAFDTSASTGKVLFLDHGVYAVSNTISVKPGVRMVGEAWPRIMAGGAYFADEKNPKVILQIGTSGQVGMVELQNLVMQTYGPAPGAILIEWNLVSSSNYDPAGLWDVHTQVGGTAGTNLQFDKCPASTALQNPPNPACGGAFMLMHVTKGAAGLYMENNWLWTADHDLDYPGHGQVTIYTGRGLLVESTNGPMWLYGTAVEHNVLYNYEFANTQNVFAGMIQTETPYYQSNPSAPFPFYYNATYNDPNFDVICANSAQPGLCRKAFGLRVVDSDNVLIYGSGLYSFFENYTQSCIATNTCQLEMVSIEQEKANGKYVLMYNTNTIASQTMIEEDGVNIAEAKDNISQFPECVAYYYTV